MILQVILIQLKRMIFALFVKYVGNKQQMLGMYSMINAVKKDLFNFVDVVFNFDVLCHCFNVCFFVGKCLKMTRRQVHQMISAHGDGGTSMTISCA